jgi:hypothetical protein
MQLILVAIVIFFPQTVTAFLDKEKAVDLNQASELLQQMGGHDKPAGDMSADDASKLFAPEPAASGASAPVDDGDAVRRALEEAAKK